MKPPAKSFSGLDQFMRCERQFYYQRIAKLPQPPNKYFIVGNIYHDVIAKSIQKKPVSVPADKADALHNVARLLKEIEPLDIKHVEVWSNKINPDAEFCAKIDAISTNTPVVDVAQHITGTKDEPCVIDWKTVFGYHRRDQVEAEQSAQLALYCLEAKVNNAAFVEIPVDIARPIRTMVVHYEDDELEAWRRYFHEQFKVLQQRGPKEESYRLADFHEHLCSPRWCPYYTRCPISGGSYD